MRYLDMHVFAKTQPKGKSLYKLVLSMSLISFNHFKGW